MPSLRIVLATALLVALATVPVSADEESEPLCEFRSALIIAAVTAHIDVSAWGKQGTTDRRLDQIEEATSA